MLDDVALDTLFRTARTQNAWQEKPVPEALLRDLYDLMKMGPTSANCSPARLIFLTTPEAKEKLRPALSAGNLAKTMAAPVTVIVALDEAFYEKLPKLFPHVDARPWFTSNAAFAATTAMRNGSLQGAYMMLAARCLGIDVGAMSGFDVDKVNDAFMAGTTWKVNFLCNLGYGAPAGVKERLPRLDFDEACKIL